MGGVGAMPGCLSLSDFTAQTYVLERALRPESVRQLSMTVNAFERWRGAHIPLCELTDALLNQWIVAQQNTHAPKTIRRRRGDILAVWRYAAYEHNLCEPPKRIRKVRVPDRVPDAWDLPTLRKMLAAAESHDDYYPNGVRIGSFWGAFIRVGYDTALRLSDLLSLPHDIVTLGGDFSVVQRKTGRAIRCRLRLDTLAAVKSTFPPERELVFGWPFSREVFWAHWARYVLGPAGVPRGRRNGPQKLRRTSASHLESVHRGAASQHLGHATAELARKSYVDPLIAEPEKPLPPGI